MRIILLSLLLACSFSYAQKAEVISFETNDRIFRGKLGENTNITMYLKVEQSSDNVGYIYSVSGWYYYNKIGTSIPLVGIWTGGNVHLFVSDDEKFNKNILSFIYEGEKGKEYLDNFIYDLESYSEKLPEIKERFHLNIEPSGIQGEWKSNGKQFKVSIYGNKFQIKNEFDYLKLPNGAQFDLSNLGIPGRADFEIIASANNDKNLVLDYSYQANLNYNGRCGGAATSGKLALVFNENYELREYTNAEFVNCYRDLTVDDLEKVSETITKYKTYSYSSSKSESYILDIKKATLKKVEE